MCFASFKSIIPVLSEEKVIRAFLENDSARDFVLHAAYE